MSFAIDMSALLDRASKRAAQHGYPATPDTRLPELAAKGSQVATVAGYPASEQSKAQERPNRLTPEQGDVAHAEPWDDAAIAPFQASAAAIQRRGFTQEDAGILAEQLRLRDLHADYRHLCLECSHLGGRVGAWRCGNHKAADVGRELPFSLVTMFQRCAGFTLAPGLN